MTAVISAPATKLGERERGAPGLGASGVGGGGDVGHQRRLSRGSTAR